MKYRNKNEIKREMKRKDHLSSALNTGGEAYDILLRF